MIWISRIGLALISLFLVIGLVAVPAEFMTILAFLGIVGVLGVWAEMERLERLGKGGLAGISKRRTSAINLGLGVLCVLLTLLALTNESYFVAAYNALGAVLLLFVGVRGLFLVPNRAFESGRAEKQRAAQRGR
jgi:hypothetical protein